MMWQTAAVALIGIAVAAAIIKKAAQLVRGRGRRSCCDGCPSCGECRDSSKCE